MHCSNYDQFGELRGFPACLLHNIILLIDILPTCTHYHSIINAKCAKMRLVESLTFDFGSIQLSFHTGVFSIKILLYSGQIALRVCTSVLFSYCASILSGYDLTDGCSHNKNH